jgi:hypothetical protein
LHQTSADSFNNSISCSLDIASNASFSDNFDIPEAPFHSDIALIVLKSTLMVEEYAFNANRN